jgi:SPP1 family phage portal protein
MEQIIAIKERKFKKSLQRRLELMTNVFNLKGKNWDWRDVNITFSRNMPQNLIEIAQIVSQLKGIVSDETLLAQIPFVEDVVAELERLEQGRDSIDLDMIPPAEDEADDITAEAAPVE